MLLTDHQFVSPEDAKVMGFEVELEQIFDSVSAKYSLGNYLEPQFSSVKWG